MWRKRGYDAKIVMASIFLLTQALTAGEVFRFAPRDGSRFIRTLRRTFRVETDGVVRTESTILEASFAFRQIASGYRLVMAPRSFRYIVNDHDVPSPVWGLIRGRDLRMEFNVVGRLTNMSGYDDIDELLTAQRRALSETNPSFHLDRIAIGEEERRNWNERILLWLSQPADPGTKVEFDSRERSFTGEPVKSHTRMHVVRKKNCDGRDCVITRYSMVPDVGGTIKRANEYANIDTIDATASEALEQLIEPATMMPHYEKLTWQMSAKSAGAEEGRGISLVTLSTFTYPAAKPQPRH